MSSITLVEENAPLIRDWAEGARPKPFERLPANMTWAAQSLSSSHVHKGCSGCFIPRWHSVAGLAMPREIPRLTLSVSWKGKYDS